MKIDKFRIITYKVGFACIIGIMILRLSYMQIFHQNFYQKKSENELNKTVEIYPNRGSIYDRNKIPLAVTQIAYSIYVNPKQLENIPEAARIMSTHLEMTPQEIMEKIQGRNNFAWIKKKVKKEVYEKLNKEKIEGVYFVKDEELIYPFEHIASDVLGFVGIDNQGLGGLEYYYDAILKGTPGKITFEGDVRKNRLITGKFKTLQHSYDGHHIITTLDYFVQYTTQKYLEENVIKNRAEHGSAIVMDIRNGDILAMADYPNYNNNDFHKTPINIRKNASISDVYEPGSTFKLLTFASVIDAGLATPETIITVPETLTLYNHTIKEAHKRPAGESNQKSVSQIIEESLNVGTAIMARKLGEEKFNNYVQAFGIGKKTGVELPGESSGLFRARKNWSGLDLAVMSFGQGVAVTPIQIARAVATIANDGIAVEPHIIKHITDSEEKMLQSPNKKPTNRVISSKTAALMRNIMINTVEKGTGTIAKINGYYIAGKTGTAQKAARFGGGYGVGQYVASFIGFFPAEKPRYLILVSIDSPHTTIYGSAVSGPAFRDIAKSMIDYYNIPPSRPISENVKIVAKQ